MQQVRRGDLLVTQSVEPNDGLRTVDQRSTYHLALVTSATRERQLSRARRITGRDTDSVYLTAGALAPSFWTILPAATLHVADAVAAITATRSRPGAVLLPPYTSPVELARDLAPWRRGDHDLGELRSAAYRFTQEDDDKRCARCGVTCRDRARIEFDTNDCPVAFCDPACPVGVAFVTDYPVGTQVQITQGFAAGATVAIKRVSDSFVNEPFRPQDPPEYVGRSYVVDLPYWGRRPMTEDIVRPVDEALVNQHAVRRPAPGVES
jgi:hypothetical protein